MSECIRLTEDSPEKVRPGNREALLCFAMEPACSNRAYACCSEKLPLSDRVISRVNSSVSMLIALRSGRASLSKTENTYLARGVQWENDLANREWRMTSDKKVMPPYTTDKPHIEN